MSRSTSWLALAALASSLACAPLPSQAHTDEFLETQQAPHGGQLRMAGMYHFELVVARAGEPSGVKPVVVHVTDHAGAKVSTAGATGTATILSGKQRSRIALAPAGDNRLEGKGSYAASPDMKVVVSITMPGQGTEQARFTPLASAASAPKKAAAAHGEHAGH